MTNKVTIFVEGENDELFLRQLIKKLYAYELAPTGEIGGIIIMKGHNSEHLYKNKFDQSNSLGYKNLVFEDADLMKNNRGLVKTKELLNAQRQNHQLTFHDFIFPNDTLLEGTLEDILVNILKSPKDEWLNCARNYYACLAKNGKIYDRKTQWNIFTSSIIEDKNLNFADENTCLIKENPYLQPLIDFLNGFFVKL
jgi:hypothetical protein